MDHCQLEFSIEVLQTLTRLDVQAYKFRTKDELLGLVNVVDSCTICCENPDIEVQTDNQTAISRETRFEVEKQDGSIHNSTIQSDKCFLLNYKKDRCDECVKQRNYLRVINMLCSYKFFFYTR